MRIGATDHLYTSPAQEPTALRRLQVIASVHKVAIRACVLTSLRFLVEIFSLQKYWAQYQNSFTASDTKTRQFSFWKIGTSVLDITDAAIQFLLVAEGLFHVGLPTTLLAKFIIPVGGSLLLLRSAIDIYHLFQSHRMQRVFVKLEQELQNNVRGEKALANFLTSHVTFSDKELQHLKAQKKLTEKEAREALQKKYFLSLERSTGPVIAKQFTLLAQQQKNGAPSLNQVKKLLKNATILYHRKKILNISLIAFSALAIVSFVCAFWQPVFVGLSLISIAFLGRLILSIYSAYFLEAHLGPEET